MRLESILSVGDFMLQQIKLNLRWLVRGERGMALLFVVVLLVSVITLYFSYGMIYHLDTKAEAVEGISHAIYV